MKCSARGQSPAPDKTNPPATSGRSAGQRYQTRCQTFDSESNHQHAGNAARQRIGGNHRQRSCQSVRNSRFGCDCGTDHNGTTGSLFFLSGKQFGRNERRKTCRDRWHQRDNADDGVPVVNVFSSSEKQKNQAVLLMGPPISNASIAPTRNACRKLH